MSKFISSNEFLKKTNDLFSVNRIREKTKFTLDKEHGNLNISHFSTGVGISYTALEGYFNKDFMIEGISQEDYSFLSFNASSSINMEDLNINKKLKFSSNSCWNGRQYNGHKALAHYHKDTYYSTHHILFESKLFNQLVMDYKDSYSSNAIFTSDHMELYFNNQINTHQKKLLQDISVLNALDDKLKELYLESKLLDLVYTSIQSIEKINKQNKFILNNKDIECIHNAKQILLKNIDEPPSIKQLAYKSAINEFKLKKGFKQLFGNTIYGYLQNHRLKKAKSLLETSDISIQEASSIVGYKSVSHFCKIFKQEFGETPLKIKQTNKKIYF